MCPDQWYQIFAGENNWYQMLQLKITETMADLSLHLIHGFRGHFCHTRWSHRGCLRLCLALYLGFRLGLGNCSARSWQTRLFLTLMIPLFGFWDGSIYSQNIYIYIYVPYNIFIFYMICIYTYGSSKCTYIYIFIYLFMYLFIY